MPMAAGVGADGDAGEGGRGVGVGDELAAVGGEYVVVVPVAQDLDDLGAAHGRELACGDDLRRVRELMGARGLGRVGIGDDLAAVGGEYVPMVAMADDPYDLIGVNLGVDEDVGRIVGCVGDLLGVNRRGGNAGDLRCGTLGEAAGDDEPAGGDADDERAGDDGARGAMRHDVPFVSADLGGCRGRR